MRNKFLSMRVYVGGTLAVLSAFLLAAPFVHAAEFIAPDKDQMNNSGQVVTNRDESHRNLYIAGGNVTVNSTTSGDLYVAGGNVLVDGTVAQDIVVAGGTVVINQAVGGDVRVAGGTVTINAPVAGDVLAYSGILTVSDKASVGGDVDVAGKDLTFNGPITGHLRAAALSVKINSKVSGPVWVRATDSLILGANAEVMQPIAYTGINQAQVDSTAKATVNFKELKDVRKAEKALPAAFMAWLVGSFILHFLALGVATLIVAYAMRGAATPVVEAVRMRPWLHLGIGVLGMIVVPITAIVLALTLVGLYVAVILFFTYLFLFAVASVFATLFLGAWVVKVLTKKQHMVLDWQAVVLGTAIMVLLPLIPVLGGMLDFMLLLMAFGALITVGWRAVRTPKITGE